MDPSTGKRFVFLGGIPVFDYMISVQADEITAATGQPLMVVGPRLLLPVGTVFRVRVEGRDQDLVLNPLANRETQLFHDEHYYSLEFGGKHGEQYDFTLCGDLDTVAREIAAAFPDRISGPDDLKIVEVRTPAEVRLGGNNKNIVQQIRTLYEAPELAGEADGITFEHLFFLDVHHPDAARVLDLYERLGVRTGSEEDVHVEGLVPRIGYVLTVTDPDGAARDRIILANRTNEHVIPTDQLNRRYFDLEYRFRRDRDFRETHLVINSMTNHEELRLVVRLLQTAYASKVTTYLCPTLTFLKCVDQLIESRFYTTDKERFFHFRKDFVYTALLPYIQYLVLNRDELSEIDTAVTKRGIDATASYITHRMNRGKQGDSLEGGRIVVTGGSKGARYTEWLQPERAVRYWKKARLPKGVTLRYADRRIVCGDDYVTDLVSTLGAGDAFTGIFIGLNALGWDGGHALRAATLGAQHFIQTRKNPRISDMVAMDETHIRLGTETELVDVISHHVEASGDPTRYGTISDTVVTIHTTQIHHPFREVLGMVDRFKHRRAD